MLPSNPLKNQFQVTLQLENRLHDIPNGFYYLLLLSCVILDKLQRTSTFLSWKRSNTVSRFKEDTS